MLQVGQRAPEFSLPGTDGGRVDEHAVDEYLDHGWSVVLVFYPFDFHPACVAQWCALRDADWLTLNEDVVVLGVSTDGAYAHRAFADEYNIEFPLLADGDGHVAEAYGVLAEEFEGHRQVASLSLFVIDPDRYVQYAWTSDDPSDSPDFDAVAKATRCRGDHCEVPVDDGGASATESEGA
jgi:peroxiredoxin